MTETDVLLMPDLEVGTPAECQCECHDRAKNLGTEVRCEANPPCCADAGKPLESLGTQALRQFSRN